jgi:hypothetical protein
MTEERKLVDAIATALRNEGAHTQRDVLVGSSSPDLLAISPTGWSSVIDVKFWQPTPGNIRRASHLASLYKSASGADAAFVVIPDLRGAASSPGVLSPSDVPRVLAASASPPSRASPPLVKKKPEAIVFAAMPFLPRYDDTFFVAMQPAALDVGGVCVRVDHEDFAGDSVAEIKRLVAESIAVIADLSVDP